MSPLSTVPRFTPARLDPSTRWKSRKAADRRSTPAGSTTRYASSRTIAALGESPEGDLLLDSPSLALVVDLLRQAPKLGARLAPALVAALAIAWAGGAPLAGGVLEVLVTDDCRPPSL